MIIEAYKTQDESFRWLDVVDPTGSDLITITKKYDLQEEFIRSVLDQDHLPKYEESGNQTFIVLRAFNVDSPYKAATLRQLTQKISIFFGPDYLITIHRKEQPYLIHIRDRWVKNLSESYPDILPPLLAKIVSEALSTYNQVLNDCEDRLEHYEKMMFQEKTTQRSIQQKFIVQRKTYVVKRVLNLMLDVINDLKIIHHYDPSLFQSIKEQCKSEKFQAENTSAHSNDLINLVLFIASHSTNEIIRLLTVVSVFFLPLSFVSSIYDMHFSSYKYGYLFFWALLVAITILLFIIFKRKGWLWTV